MSEEEEVKRLCGSICHARKVLHRAIKTQNWSSVKAVAVGLRFALPFSDDEGFHDKETEHRHGYPCVLCGAKNFEESADKCRGLEGYPGDTMSKEIFEKEKTGEE